MIKGYLFGVKFYPITRCWIYHILETSYLVFYSVWGHMTLFTLLFWLPYHLISRKRSLPRIFAENRKFAINWFTCFHHADIFSNLLCLSFFNFPMKPYYLVHFTISSQQCFLLPSIEALLVAMFDCQSMVSTIQISAYICWSFMTSNGLGNFRSFLSSFQLRNFSMKYIIINCSTELNWQLDGLLFGDCEIGVCILCKIYQARLYVFCC